MNIWHINHIIVRGSWNQNQQNNYKQKNRIMKQQEIYDIWTKFIEEYKEYFS